MDKVNVIQIIIIIITERKLTRKSKKKEEDHLYLQFINKTQRNFYRRREVKGKERHINRRRKVTDNFYFINKNE